jgi:anthranilate 1,2-dioxygenase small subunit
MTTTVDRPVDQYEVERRVRALQRRYAAAVDAKRLDEWLSLFAPECSYVVITRENIERGLPLALIHDDSTDRIHDRVVYIEHVWKGHINDYRQRHLLSDPEVVADADGIRVRQGFAVYLSEPSVAGSRLLATGEYEDEVTFVEGEPRFRAKRVILDADVLPRYFVYPL